MVLFSLACLSIIKLGLRMRIALLLKSRFYWSLHSRNLSSGVCEQPRCRPACASAQSNQCICQSLLIISNLVREKFQSFKLISVAKRGGLNLTLSETLKTGLRRSKPNYYVFTYLCFNVFPSLWHGFPLVW